MKKLIFFAGVVLLAFALLKTDRGWLPEPLRAALDRVALPFKIASLYTKAPDRQLMVPVEGVSVRQISDTWGAPRSGNRRHEGQDIFAPRGTAVRAATNGYVVRIGEDNLGGNIVSVIGAGGRNYYYAHFDAYAPGLAVGDFVTPETIIGYVGTTGNAVGTPPHLHFGVYATGGAVNPLPLLIDREEEAKISGENSRHRKSSQNSTRQ